MSEQTRIADVTDAFADRHIGPDDHDLGRILDALGIDSLEALADRVVPSSIADPADATGLDVLPPAATEVEALAELAGLAAQNTAAPSMIGLGYYGTHTPAVLRRNIVENPAWYLSLIHI